MNSLHLIETNILMSITGSEICPPEGPGSNDTSKTESPTVSMQGGETAVVFKKGMWSKEEDEKLKRAVEDYGIQNWVAVEKFSGLARPSKNCRLRWFNHLRPNLKKCPFTQEEEKIIISLHSKYGNSWSLIASKLPGRSDNEIKNYWHKRVKKCKKQRLPFYSLDKEEEQGPANSHKTKDENHNTDKKNVHDENWPNGKSFPTNTLSSSSIHFPEFQPSSITNKANTSTYSTVAPVRVSPSIDSSQTVISLPKQSQFLSSASSHVISNQQSPSNHLTQTNSSPNTPSSQRQHSMSSPSQMSQSCQSPDSAVQIQVHSLQQNSACSETFTPLRKPPILTSVKGRLKQLSRDTSQLPPKGHSVCASTSSVVNISALLPSNSSLQMQCLSPMESPTSPLKLKLPSGMPALYSAKLSSMNSQVSSLKENSHTPAASLSAFQLKSTTIVPHSPLKLHSSISVPSDSCFKSNLLIPDSDVQLNYSKAVTPPLSSPQLKPLSYYSLELPTTQTMPLDTDHVTPQDSSLTIKIEPPSTQFFTPDSPQVKNSWFHEVDVDSNSEILDELREARERVQFLKKKLRQSRISKKNSSETKAKEDMSPSRSRTKQELKRTLRGEGESSGISKPRILLNKSAKMENVLCKLRKKLNSKKRSFAQEESTEIEEIKQGENSETKTISKESLQRDEDSMAESLKKKHLITFPDHMHSIHLFNHLNSQNTVNTSTNFHLWDGTLCPVHVPAPKCLDECSITGNLFSESSTISQDNFLMGDFFHQISGMEGPLTSEGQAHVTDAFGPIYSQNTATTSVKEGGKKSYLQQKEDKCYVNSFVQESSDGTEKKFTEEKNLMACNLSETSKLCESSLLLHQYTEANLLDTDYFVSEPIFRHGFSRGEGEQSYVHTSNGGLYQDSLKTESTSIKPWIQEPSPEQNLMEGLLVENVSTEGMMVFQDEKLLNCRFNSVVNSSMMTHLTKSNNGNGESCCEKTGVLKQEEEHDHVSTMPEELSSLLEFFPTSIHTPEWYSNVNAVNGKEASDGFNTDHGLNVASPPPITVADYI